jgi:hypothetical protein
MKQSGDAGAGERCETTPRHADDISRCCFLRSGHTPNNGVDEAAEIWLAEHLLLLLQLPCCLCWQRNALL